MAAFQYLAIDWLATLLTFLAIWQIGNKNKSGFVIMICANFSWIAVGYLSASIAMIIANAGLIAMNIIAIIKWSKDDSA